MTIPHGEQLAAEATDDSRLFPALRLLERQAISVLSLDVFDTLLWRLVPEPADAFVLLGRRLQDSGVLDPAVSPALFARLRVKAELRARRRLPATVSPEVGLEEVYDELAASVFAGRDVADLVEAEVAFDRSITFPDLEVCRLARFAQDKIGARVVAVSDIYYSEAQLRALLDREELEGVTLRVFTSSQHKMGKGSGLYDLVLETLGVGPEEVLHVGDNAEADVACASKTGIHAVHFDKFPGSLRTVLEREEVIAPVGAPRPAKELDGVAGDLGLTAMRSKALSRADRGHLADPMSPYWSFGASVLGPVLTGFAEWVHARAGAEGHASVYCLMREGEFFTRLMDGARDYVGSEVVARPLWLSRQVCARASVLEASTEELTAFLQRRRAPTLQGFCDSLGIGLAQLPELFNEGGGRLDDPELRRRALHAIERRPEVQAAIVAHSAVLRQGLARYFLETVGDVERVMVVDLGWAGTIQAYLAKALRASDVQMETHGLYLATTDLAAERMLDGVRTEGYLASGGLPESAVRWIVRSPEILEQACMVDEGSLVDFTAEGQPVQAPVRQSPVQVLQRNAVQRGVVAFQREWARYHDVVPVAQRALAERASSMLLRSVLRFVLQPTEEEASLFQTWLHDEDFGSGGAETVITDDLATSLKYMTPARFLDLPMTRVYWPFGLAALYNPALGSAAHALAEGAVTAEAFAAVEPVEAPLYLDVGGGYRHVKTADAGPNGNGLCFLREHVPADAIRGIKVGLGPGAGVARVDFMRLVFSLRGRADPIKVELQWPEQFSAVRYENCAPLSENLLFGSRKAPHLAYRCPAEWGRDVYHVEVELAYAWLAISPMRGAKAARRDVVVEAGRRVVGKLRSLWQVAEGLASERARPPGG